MYCMRTWVQGGCRWRPLLESSPMYVSVMLKNCCFKWTYDMFCYSEIVRWEVVYRKLCCLLDYCSAFPGGQYGHHTIAYYIYQQTKQGEEPHWNFTNYGYDRNLLLLEAGQKCSSKEGLYTYMLMCEKTKDRNLLTCLQRMGSWESKQKSHTPNQHHLQCSKPASSPLFSIRLDSQFP